MKFIRSRTVRKALYVKQDLGQDHILYLYYAELDPAPENSVFFFSEMGEPQPLHQRDAYGKYLY
jgi:hypothetical protein